MYVCIYTSIYLSIYLSQGFQFIEKTDTERKDIRHIPCLFKQLFQDKLADIIHESSLQSIPANKCEKKDNIRSHYFVIPNEIVF